MDNNAKIKQAIRKISAAGEIKAIQILTGYVTTVYPVGDEKYGLVDFASLDGSRYITGVSLSSIDNNSRGDITLPAEDSEITIMVLNNVDAYVLLYTHIDTRLIDVNSSFKVIATGVKPMDDNTDYDEVEVTGESSFTEHTPTGISSSVIDVSGSNDKINASIKTSSSSSNTVTDNGTGKSTAITQTPDDVMITSGNVTFKQTETGTEVVAPQIKLGNGNASEKAVLGNVLKTVLGDFIDQVAQIKTTTAIGPQPILNIPTVMALKSRLDTILSQVNLIE